MKILLVSHGDFATGLEKTMRDFFGATNIFSATVLEESGTKDLVEKAKNHLNEWSDETVLICSDLKGGSANQAVFPFLARENVQIITGMNLPLILQLYLEDDPISSERLTEIIQYSKEEIQLLNMESLKDNFDDDDE